MCLVKSLSLKLTWIEINFYHFRGLLFLSLGKKILLLWGVCFKINSRIRLVGVFRYQMAIAQWLLHFDLIWQNWSCTMKSIFSQKNRSCHTGTDHLSTQSSAWTHLWGSKSLLYLHPAQILIIYHWGKQCSFLLLTVSPSTPCSSSISLPWNFFFFFFFKPI